MKLQVVRISLLFTVFSGVPALEKCRREEVPVDFDSVSVYPSFDFTAKWTTVHKHFWKSDQFNFESRYLKLNATTNSSNAFRRYRHREHPFRHQSQSPPQVKVVLLPYSHNDPGWKQTFEGYYYSFTRKILNNSITKLVEYPNMTFAWSEIVFLSKWWDEASKVQKETLRRLVREGRFEILSGGWVMPDEAATSLFGLVTQLVEGHQWMERNLNVSPKFAWSIDPFGHSSSMPYILKKADIEGMMIQRIHYGWKHWLAEHRKGDFVWFPRWSSDKNDAMPCHNAHYDLYPTKHSCGPNPVTCMGFDFRDIPDKLEEQQRYMKQVSEDNLSHLSDKLVGEYRRTASLTQHNIVLTTLGGDFRFDEAIEWDQQHNNYQKLFNFINSNPFKFHTSVKFGTLSEYFQTIQERNITLPTFRGDFLPYSDVLFPFSPAYWTGYYGTRPFWKKFCREVEDELLKAEILFTFTYNLMRHRNHSSFRILHRNYDNLVQARRTVALFQHHDGITGTSPRSTMLDYAKKLAQAWSFSRQIQKVSIELIWRNELKIRMPPLADETVRNGFTGIAEKSTVKLFRSTVIVKKLVIFNSLGWKRSHLVRVIVEDPLVVVKGHNGRIITAQINPKLARLNISHQSIPKGRKLFELVFIAELPPLSIVTYEIQRQPRDYRDFSHFTVQAKVSCRNCDSSADSISRYGTIILENQLLKAHFSGETGMLTGIEDKANRNVKANVTMQFGVYQASYGSGAYLLSPSSSFFSSITNSSTLTLHRVEGPILTEIVLLTDTMRFSTYLLQKGTPEAMSALFMSNEFNGTTDKFGEFFMRFQTDLNNGNTTSSQLRSQRRDEFNWQHAPVIFTDSNGLGVEKRTTIRKLPYQANHYPVTNFAFIQDNSKGVRCSLAVDRSHGISSAELGRMELIFDRRLRYDDARGMNEGVMDAEAAVSTYALKLESIPEFHSHDNFHSWEPSLGTQRMAKILNSWPAIFTYDALSTDPNGKVSLFSGEFPRDVYLLNLRTLSGSFSNGIKSFPSSTALMTLHTLGHFENRRNCTGSVKLKASMALRHSLRKTNLVGTKTRAGLRFQAGSINAENSTFQDSKHLPVGLPYELSSYLINF